MAAGASPTLDYRNAHRSEPRVSSQPPCHLPQADTNHPTLCNHHLIYPNHPNHPNHSNYQPRRTLPSATTHAQDQTSSDQLYCLALVARRDLACLRDLTQEHLPLLENLRDKGCQVGVWGLSGVGDVRGGLWAVGGGRWAVGGGRPRRPANAASALSLGDLEAQSNCTILPSQSSTLLT